MAVYCPACPMPQVFSGAYIFCGLCIVLASAAGPAWADASSAEGQRAALWWFAVAVLALGVALLLLFRSARLIGHRARLDAVVESAMDAIITADEKQRIVLFNAAAEQMFGCTKTDAIGRGLDTFIP